MNNFLKICVRKWYRYTAGAMLILFVFLVLMAAFLWALTYEKLYDQAAIDLEALSTPRLITELSSRYIVVRPKQILDTGVREGKKRSGMDFTFLLAPVKDRWLLMKTRKGYESKRFSGRIVELKDWERDYFFQHARIANPDVKGGMLPIMLDCTLEDEFQSAIYFSICSISLCVACIAWIFFKTVVCTVIPKWHPIWSRLRGYGELNQLAQELDAEASHPDTVLQAGMLITPKWIIHRPETSVNGIFTWLFWLRPSPFTFWVIPLEDVIWLYVQGSQAPHGHVGAKEEKWRPLSPSVFAWVNPLTDVIWLCVQQSQSQPLGHIGTRQGKLRLLSARSLSVINSFDVIHRRVPWAIYDNSAHYCSLWKHDMKQFCELVDANRQSAVVD